MPLIPTAELASRGFEDVRPVHNFAMRGIIAGADNVSDLGRRLSVSNRPLPKPPRSCKSADTVASEPYPGDARRKRLLVTARGREVMRAGEAIFDELRDQWMRQIGSAELHLLETHLAALVGAFPEDHKTLGLIAEDPGEPK